MSINEYIAAESSSEDGEDDGHNRGSNIEVLLPTVVLKTTTKDKNKTNDKGIIIKSQISDIVASVVGILGTNSNHISTTTNTTTLSSTTTEPQIMETNTISSPTKKRTQDLITTDNTTNNNIPNNKRQHLLQPTTTTPPQPISIISITLLAKNRPPFPSDLINMLKQILSSQDNFKYELNPSIQQQARSLLIKFGLDEYISSLSSIRAGLLPVIASKACTTIRNPTSKILETELKMYTDKTQSILEIAKRYDAPPTTMLRELIKFRHPNGGVSSKVLTNFISGKTTNQSSSNSWFTPYDFEQRNLALLYDDTCSNHDELKLDSIHFEKRIEQFLTLHQVQFHRPEIDKKKSNNVPTPDFIIKSENFTINNLPIKWVEVKDYGGGFSGVFDKNNRDQVMNYVSAFGPGAIVYSQGVTINHMLSFNTDSILVMDVKWLENC
jgi:hypothetical protein